MAYKIEVTTAAEKDIAHLNEPIIGRVRETIDGLADNPRPPGSKPLKGKHKGKWRVRVGDYRIIYTINDAAKVVRILAVKPRGGAY